MRWIAAHQFKARGVQRLAIRSNPKNARFDYSAADAFNSPVANSRFLRFHFLITLGARINRAGRLSNLL